MKCYAAIDTNVLVSALLAKRDNSAPVQVVRAIFAGEVKPVFSAEIIQEYKEVLHRAKFHFSREKVDRFLEQWIELGMILEANETGISLPDMSDVPFYAVTLSSGTDATFLVTGNTKHFPAEKFIVTPAQFIEILQKKDKC